MLSRQHRTIFVHIPKTGGQSVETVFLRSHGLNWEQRAALLLRQTDDTSRGPRRLAHLYAAEYVGLGHATSEEFSSFFKFAVVRNPWARAVSNYKYIMPKRELSFEVFLDRIVIQRLQIDDTRQVDPQVRYLLDGAGKILVDRVVRFENLATEFPEISRQIFGREEPLPKVNISRDRRDYRTFYTPETRRLVAEKYRDDIEMFGYEFDGG